MKKRLSESLYDNTDYIEDMQHMLKHCAELHKGEEYALLGVLLGYLRSLAMIHQSHHWQTSGKEYYADHLLFQRLYDAIGLEVDSLAEKIVGSDGVVLTNYFAQMHHMKYFMENVSKSESLITESYRAELMFVIAGEIVMEYLESKDLLTRGIEQALGNILDRHETHIYLLKQRHSG